MSEEVKSELTFEYDNSIITITPERESGIVKIYKIAMKRDNNSYSGLMKLYGNITLDDIQKIMKLTFKDDLYTIVFGFTGDRTEQFTLKNDKMVNLHKSKQSNQVRRISFSAVKEVKPPSHLNEQSNSLVDSTKSTVENNRNDDIAKCMKACENAEQEISQLKKKQQQSKEDMKKIVEFCTNLKADMMKMENEVTSKDQVKQLEEKMDKLNELIKESESNGVMQSVTQQVNEKQTINNQNEVKSEDAQSSLIPRTLEEVAGKNYVFVLTEDKKLYGELEKTMNGDDVYVLDFWKGFSQHLKPNMIIIISDMISLDKATIQDMYPDIKTICASKTECRDSSVIKYIDDADAVTQIICKMA